ncbi:methylaspartate mutase subunit E [Marinobacter halodurans]|uniref:Methylaspartate mutase subunit E n=1 Tax=Marinobacter halodurans TaxID=2528979 RepID=A0ABY1ZDZ8_9GAMM|nr:methylaspartate mutase subunit E [Marinobacter halodurans]TBW47799.1 methylaspartate mutase subunit E [Marinobacter halodurans]
MSTKHHSLVLGGIGGDSHSVGLNILKHALSHAGYQTHFLGINNSLDDFLELSDQVNAVLISCMDGHARHYLRSLQSELKRGKALWYLGGNLAVGSTEGVEAHFVSKGFDRVYANFVDISTVLEALKTDLHTVEPVVFRAPATRAGCNVQGSKGLATRISSRLEFLNLRDEVLRSWPSGAGAKSLQDNARFLEQVPSFAQALKGAHDKHTMIVQPRSGVPDASDQEFQFKIFRDNGVRAVSYQIDSMTRNNNYSGAAKAIRESAKGRDNCLNGFPLINYNIDVLREITKNVALPIQTRHSTRDPRLLAEMSYAGGVTAFEGGPISYNIPYYKDYPLSDALSAWRYVDFLTGYYYQEHGIVLDREFFGTLTATLIPPCIAIATNVLEALLAAGQGVKCVSLAYAEQGNRCQDIAAIEVMGSLAREILGEHGYDDVDVYTNFHQYMAAFPQSRWRSEQLIAASATTAALSGATRMIVKAPAESRSIPTLEDNLRALELVDAGIARAEECTVNHGQVAAERALIRKEASALINSVLEIQEDSLEQKIVRAFELGRIDIPFAPSIHNRGIVRTLRDLEGAVRFLDVGHLELDRESREFHEQKVNERRNAETTRGNHLDDILIEHDVLQLFREQYPEWPLDRYSPNKKARRRLGVKSCVLPLRSSLRGSGPSLAF